METNRPPAPKLELNSNPFFRRTVLWIFAGVLTGLLVVGGYFAVDFAKQPTPPDAQIRQEKSGKSTVQATQQVRGVQVLKPQQRDISYTVRLPATLSPITQVTLYAKVSGYLTSILVDKGDPVAAGQVLAVIDAPPSWQNAINRPVRLM